MGSRWLKFGKIITLDFFVQWSNIEYLYNIIKYSSSCSVNMCTNREQKYCFNMEYKLLFPTTLEQPKIGNRSFLRNKYMQLTKTSSRDAFKLNLSKSKQLFTSGIHKAQKHAH